MKVLHVITGLADGGAQAVLYRLCAYDDLDQNVVISLMDEGKYGPLLESCGADVHCLNIRHGTFSPGAVFRLRRIVVRYRPDVIQTWMYHADLLGGLAATLSGIPNVWGIHHSSLAPGKSKRTTIAVARCCAFLSRLVPTRVICCSQRAAEMHVRLGYVQDKLVVVPNGYDVTYFSPDEANRLSLRTDWDIGDDVLLFGMVARYNPQKDHPNLFSALSQVKKNGIGFKCVLIGAGMSRQNTPLVSSLRENGIEDDVLLFEERSDIPAVMNALDVHVLSSAYGEAFPNVLCEAMACETPCVATDVGDAALIIGDTGWVVPPNDPGSLCSGLLSAMSARQDRDAWNSRRKAARRRIIERFSLPTMVESYRRTWRQATGQACIAS